jgi:glycosyltransferase involved in cell wall biosynthesis
VKLVMTLLVRDLEDIVEANLAYHLSRGVDHVIVTDNGSVDGTRSIVERFVRDGRATLIDEPRDDYDQSAWVTRMARCAAAAGADWVIHCDADELWWPAEGDLKTALARVAPAYGAVIYPRSNLLPLRRLDGHPFERMVIRQAHSVNGLGRPLPGKIAHRGSPNVVVAAGNHAVRDPALGETLHASDVLIFHFPHRSYAQLERKIRLGGAAVARNTVERDEVFDVWRSLYAALQAGTLRAWYDALPHADDPGVERLLADGELVRDTRLASYLRERVWPALAAAQ